MPFLHQTKARIERTGRLPEKMWALVVGKSGHKEILPIESIGGHLELIAYQNGHVFNRPVGIIIATEDLKYLPLSDVYESYARARRAFITHNNRVKAALFEKITALNKAVLAQGQAAESHLAKQDAAHKHQHWHC